MPNTVGPTGPFRRRGPQRKLWYDVHRTQRLEGPASVHQGAWEISLDGTRLGSGPTSNPCHVQAKNIERAIATHVVETAKAEGQDPGEALIRWAQGLGVDTEPVTEALEIECPYMKRDQAAEAVDQIVPPGVVRTGHRYEGGTWYVIVRGLPDALDALVPRGAQGRRQGAAIGTMPTDADATKRREDGRQAARDGARTKTGEWRDGAKLVERRGIDRPEILLDRDCGPVLRFPMKDGPGWLPIELGDLYTIANTAHAMYRALTGDSEPLDSDVRSPFMRQWPQRMPVESGIPDALIEDARLTPAARLLWVAMWRAAATMTPGPPRIRHMHLGVFRRLLGYGAKTTDQSFHALAQHGWLDVRRPEPFVHHVHDVTMLLQADAFVAPTPDPDEYRWHAVDAIVQATTASMRPSLIRRYITNVMGAAYSPVSDVALSRVLQAHKASGRLKCVRRRLANTPKSSAKVAYWSLTPKGRRWHRERDATWVGPNDGAADYERLRERESGVAVPDAVLRAK